MNVTKSLLHITALLLTSMAVLSCSMEMEDGSLMESNGVNDSNSVMVNGIIADEDKTPLEGICIQFEEFITVNGEEVLFSSTTAHSDKTGMYTIYIQGAETTMRCVAKATDGNGIYQTQTKEIFVTWDGPSFDKDSKLFVVNDCNFIMKK